MAITNASSNAPADPADGFHLMRPELDIAYWQVELYGAFHGDFMMRLWAYRLQEPDPSGTNKFLFERDEHRDFPLAARYFLNELCETVGRGRRRFACPLPEGTYKRGLNPLSIFLPLANWMLAPWQAMGPGNWLATSKSRSSG